MQGEAMHLNRFCHLLWGTLKPFIFFKIECFGKVIYSGISIQMFNTQLLLQQQVYPHIYSATITFIYKYVHCAFAIMLWIQHFY